MDSRVTSAQEGAYVGAAMWGLALLAAALLSVSAAGPRSAGAAEASTRPSAIILVNADEELAGFLAQAGKLVAAGSYDRAIGILQALHFKSEHDLVAAGGRRYVPLSVKVNELIGKMGPEGLKLYRRLYDHEARVIYDRALKTGKAGLLRDVVRRYRHTSYGAGALEQLGAVCFDRGRFARAQYYWRQALPLRTDAEHKAGLLARIATAQHLAGDAKRARATANLLKQRFGQTACRIAGRVQKAGDFVDRMLKQAPPARPGPALLKNWPGLGGLPDGLGSMPDSNVVLAARWRNPATKPASSEKPSRPELVAWGTRGSQKDFSMRLLKGHVTAKRLRYSGAKRARLAPMVHPLVLGDRVIYRTDRAVVVCDMLTGETLWSTKNRFPLWTGGTAPEAYFPHYLFRAGGAPGDRGLYLLTAGGGKIFVRHGLRLESDIEGAAVIRRLNPRLAGGGKGGASSALAAIDATPARCGKLVWQVGSGRGDDELVRVGKFASAPTYASGRLYILVVHIQQYFMVCLNAETGATIWKAPICQAPATADEYRGYAGFALERCSPPALAGGRVFALPNVGAIVAIDAETGWPLWAYEYDSRLNRAASYSRWPGPYVMDPRGRRPLNPIVVMGWRLICLPADTRQLIALTADDGKWAWPKPAGRCDQRHLSPIGADRLLLSGPGLVVLSAKDGRELARPAGAKGVAGRPAVTQSQVLASGQGTLFRMDLKTYALSQSELVDPDGLLGNLVSTGDALIAANSAGVCAYFSFEVARKKTDERIARAKPNARAQLIFKRAQLAYYAGVFDQALADLTACAKTAEKTEDDLLAKRVQTWIARTHVALGNQADGDRDMLARFRQARQSAATADQEAHVLLRLAKACQKSGDHPAAAAAAQEIYEKFGNMQIADVPIGPEANRQLNFEQVADRTDAKPLARKFIARLIALHGQSVYAEFDAKAAAELKAARASRDATRLHAIHRRWPNSLWADDAMYAAAEFDYLTAQQQTGDQADETLGRVAWSLSEVSRMSDSPLRVPATAALAAIYARRGNKLIARLTARRVSNEPKDTPVNFADIEASLDQILHFVRTGRMPTTAPATAPAGSHPANQPPKPYGRGIIGAVLQRGRIGRSCTPANVGSGIARISSSPR